MSPGDDSLTIKFENDRQLPILVTDAGTAAAGGGNAAAGAPGGGGNAGAAAAGGAAAAAGNAGGGGAPKVKSASASGGGGQSKSSFEESSSSSQYDNFARTKKQSKDALKISKKNVKTTEINFGGLPNADWREWASTVKDRPMPILYDLVGIWNLMEDDVAASWYNAFKYIEGIKESELLSEENNSVLSALHFGVSTGTGEAHSAYYSNDPNSEYRALIQVDKIPSILGSAGEDEQKLLIVGDGMTNGYSVSLPFDKAVCGIKTTRMLPRPLIPSCYWRINWNENDLEDDSDDSCKIVYNPNEGDKDPCGGCNYTDLENYYCGSNIDDFYHGDRPRLRELIETILPRQKSVSKIELQLCKIEDGRVSDDLSESYLSLGEIDQAFPDSPFLIEAVQSYYEKYRNVTSNSTVEAGGTDLNIRYDKATCDPGYIMDGICVRKCLEEGDPLCIDDYVFGKDPHPRINFKDVNKCKEKVDWEDYLSLVRKPYGGILGIQISCNKPNGSPSDRVYKEVFCTNVQPGVGPDTNINDYSQQQQESLTHLCGDDTQWDPWVFLPRGEGTFWTFSGGVAQSKRRNLFYAQFPDARYNGITDLQLTARELIEPGSGFSGDVVTYSATWSSKGSKPVALFASTIRGHIGYNTHEENKELSIEDPSTNERTISFINTIPFAISDDFSSPGVIAMSRFNRVSMVYSSFHRKDFQVIHLLCSLH